MHASTLDTRANEETFKILLKIMEKHFETLSILDTEPERKRNNAVNVSEVRRVVLEQSYQGGLGGNLIRRYSCEEMFDQHSNTRQVKISQLLRADNEESMKRWQARVPCFGTHENIDQHSQNKSNMLMGNGVEDMEVDDNSFPEIPVFPVLEKKEAPTVSLNTLPCSKIHEIAKDSVPDTLDRKDSLKSQFECKNVGVTSHGADDIKNMNYADIKKKVRSLVPLKSDGTSKKSARRWWNCWMLLFFVLLPIVILLMAAAFYEDEFTVDFECEQSGYYVNASQALWENIYGQEQALYSLINFLQINSCVKAVALVGGIGVGKSYTAQIIAKNFPNETNIYFYYPPLNSEAVSERFSKTYCSLIVIDNLTKQDIDEAAAIIASIKALKNYCVTILAIFNMENVDAQLQRYTDLSADLKIVKDTFSSKSVSIKAIGYGMLTEEALENCIKDVARRNKVSLTDDNVKDIKKNLIKSGTGCKGAYSQVQLLGTLHDSQ